jgi:teichuronic acid exporter
MSPTERPHYSTRFKGQGSLGQVARTSVMWAYVRTAVIGLIGVPATIVLARLLSPADFGIAAAAIFFGQLAARLSSGGLGSALVRIKIISEDHISTVFVVNAVMAVLGSLALILAAPYIAAFYGSPEVGRILPLVALNFTLGALSSVQQALLSRDLRYREMATIGSLDTLVGAVSAVVFASLGFRYWSLVLGDVCGAFVKWIGGIWFVGWHVRPRFVPAAAREMGSFAMGSYVQRLLLHMTRSVDQVVIGRMLGLTALGFYDKAFSVGNKVYSKMTVVGPAVSFRIFSIIQDEPERFRRAYRKVIMSATILGYVVFAGLATVAPHLLVVALGERWEPAVLPFQVLCVAFALKLLNQYATAAAQAKGWIWPQVWRQIVQILCIIVGVYFAAPWGIAAASLAVLGASIVQFFLTQSMMRRATGLGWADILAPQTPALAISAALVSVLWGIDAYLATKGAAHAVVLAAQVGSAAVLLLAFARWCPFQDTRTLMHDIVSDFSPRIAGVVWKDVATAQRDRKRRQAERADAVTPAPDSTTQLVQ